MAGRTIKCAKCGHDTDSYIEDGNVHIRNTASVDGRYYHKACAPPISQEDTEEIEKLKKIHDKMKDIKNLPKSEKMDAKLEILKKMGISKKDSEEIQKLIEIKKGLPEHQCEKCGSKKGLSFIDGHYLCSRHAVISETKERHFKEIGSAVQEGSESLKRGTEELREHEEKMSKAQKGLLELQEMSARALHGMPVLPTEEEKEVRKGLDDTKGMLEKLKKMQKPPAPPPPPPSARPALPLHAGPPGAPKVVIARPEQVATGRCFLCGRGTLSKVREFEENDEVVTDYKCSNPDCPSNV